MMVVSNNPGYTQGAPKMLLMADKNQQQQFMDARSADEYTMSMVESSDSKNRNRLKSNNYNGVNKKDSLIRNNEDFNND